MTTKSPDAGPRSKEGPKELDIHQDRRGFTGSGNEQERRRRLRLGLSSELFKISPQGKVFSLADLSSEGMALRILDADDFILLTLGAQIEGTLNLAGHKLAVAAQVMHLSPQVVGCRFGSLSSAVQRHLEAFLSPASQGSALRLIPAGSDPGTLWYHGQSGTDLLFSGLNVSETVDCDKVTLYTQGVFIQWQKQEGLSTGVSRLADASRPGRSEGWGIVQFETLLMDADAQPDTEKLSIAKAMILGSKLPEDLKKWCLHKFISN